MHLGEILHGRRIGPAFVDFCKHTKGPQQDLLNHCVFLFVFVCALRGLLIIITVL